MHVKAMISEARQRAQGLTRGAGDDLLLDMADALEALTRLGLSGAEAQTLVDELAPEREKWGPGWDGTQLGRARLLISRQSRELADSQLLVSTLQRQIGEMREELAKVNGDFDHYAASKLKQSGREKLSEERAERAEAACDAMREAVAPILHWLGNVSHDPIEDDVETLEAALAHDAGRQVLERVEGLDRGVTVTIHCLEDAADPVTVRAERAEAACAAMRAALEWVHGGWLSLAGRECCCHLIEHEPPCTPCRVRAALAAAAGRGWLSPEAVLEIRKLAEKISDWEGGEAEYGARILALLPEENILALLPPEGGEV
jgi:hypothetical protein